MTPEHHTPIGEGGILRLNYKGRIVCGVTMLALMDHTLHAVPPKMGDYHVHEHYDLSVAHENTANTITLIRSNVAAPEVANESAKFPISTVTRL